MEQAIETIDGTASPAEAGLWKWSRPLDIGTAREFHALALEIMKPGERGRVILDLSETPHLDACGLQILVAMAVQALSRGRFFEIGSASYAVQRDLQLAGVSYLMRQE